ncbi:uncharacterized protein LOC129575793 isoform X4 [Sitodiplosis mosellana]|uniref:uncharacterized protein LOC129575793 isoform X4 n=1 Tax=Sitodiplosis mosellana TaxID=263140 RepID=UPI0024443884|nr:uncharacterized protein LOC129575793 isoform X4 [Sitodiplosis mosellana]
MIYSVCVLNIDFSEKSRQTPPKISLRRTSLESFCSPREQPFCSPLTRRYRTHDGTCNNARKGRWGAANMPFNRFQSPAYADGIEELRQSTLGGPLPSPRFISLMVHGSKESDSPVTLMLAQWGQFVDHDLTSTLQPRSVNGSVPQCCGVSELHPSCAPIRVPTDDPWLAPFGIRCLEFLRSAPAQRRDCLLSWREQTNQVTSYLDASTIYSSSERSSERSRLFTNGLLLYGRGPPRDDVCLRGALANQCIRAGDLRSGEQPGLLAMHHTWVLEHNRIANNLADMNLHWSDEKIYQETRRIIGAMVQHITYREFLPLVLGREVCKLFDLELQNTGYYTQYDVRTNPTVANSFSAAAFRFGHSLIQNTYMRSTRNHEFLDNNVTLHEENFNGDIGSAGSLHRLLRGLSIQRAQKRDEFITAELTNHLFQSGSFPFGLDLAAINIQRGRDHGLPAYTQWREPCGLTAIINWDDLERVVGPKSANRMRLAYKSIDDIDLFVGGLAERPVVGGLVGPVFACIIAQQFSNLRKGDRFWYENGDIESSFTPAQLQSIRQVNLAQVICRALTSGTLQPHVFLPHTVSTNERQLCGTGSLTPIDLKPWLERDPFLKNTQSANESTVKVNNGQAMKPPHIQTINANEKIIIKLDLPQSQDNPIDIRNEDELFSVNGTVVNNKLDLDTTRSHATVLNRLPIDVTNKINTRPKTQTNKKPKTTMTTTTTIRSPTTKRTKKRNNKNHNRRKHKRDVTNDDTVVKARSSIVIKIDKPTEDGVSTHKTPFNGATSNNKRRIDKEDSRKVLGKEYVIVTPDQNAFDIEIKIKPKPPKNEKIIVPTNANGQLADVHATYYNDYATATATTTKRPHQFYQIAQPSFSDGGQYGVSAQDEIIKPQKPTYDETYETIYNGLIVKRTTTKIPTTTAKTTTRRPYVIYNVQQNEYTPDTYYTTKKPYYTTKRPFFSYGESNIQNDDKPFYSYPTVQNTDASSYYSSNNANNNNDNNNHDEFVSSIQNSNPYQTKPQHNPPYLSRPSATKPSSLNNHNYGQFDDDDHTHNVRPQNNYQSSNYYGPIYLDDFSTKPPDKLTTTFIVHSDDEEYLDTGYGGSGSVTTSRPHDFTTFYTVQTTRKKKKTTRPTRKPRPTRPTRPIQPAYGQNDEDDEDEDDDDDGYFNPSSVFSNLVSTFNGYFGSGSTTTRKPYITQQDENFYTYPSLPTNDFPYSRQPSKKGNDDNDEEEIERSKHARKRRNSDINDDYEQTTYPAAVNVNYNDDIADDSVIAFDRDGYLRPEYMNYDSHTNAKLYFDVNSKIDTRHLHTSKTHEITNVTRYQPPFNDYRVHYLLNGHYENARHHKQITTLTDNNRNRGQSVRIGVSDINQPIGLIPLNVLTKPERPDNWVMYDAMHKVPLPRMPQITSEYEENSNEMPRPIAIQRNAPAA